MNIEKIAKAIEKDAGVDLPDLRESLTEMQQDQTARTYTPEQILVRSARTKTALSQQAFADLIRTPVATVRDWEQGRFTPPGGVICLLQITLKYPDLVRELT